MIMYVEIVFFELSVVLSSSDIGSQHLSQNEDILDDTNGVSHSKCMGTSGLYQLNGQSHPYADINASILLCEGLSWEQWVGLDVVILNDDIVPMVDGICRNSRPHECVDANPLGEDNVGVCILNPLLMFEILLMWRFSLH